MTGRIAALAVVAAAVVALAGCGTGPVSLSLRSGTVSACYRALPVAKIAIDDPSAKLKGVHREAVDKLEHDFPTVTLPSGDDDSEVCVFAFDGTFKPGQVKGAPADQEGNKAVVVVSSKSLRLVASYVGSSIPHELGRRLADH